MSDKAVSSSSSGIGFCGLLTIVFITLKLTHVINWSWWWVLAPWWGPLALIAVLVVAAGAVYLFFMVVVAVWEGIDKGLDQRRRKRISASKITP